MNNMKRFFILISCILLIVSLSISAFAAGLDWQDYVVSATPGYEYDIKDVYIPADDVNIWWSSSYGGSARPLYSFTVSESSNVTINGTFFSPSDYLSVEGIDESGGIDIYFRMNNEELTYLSGVTYYWTDGSQVLSYHLALSHVEGWNGVFTVDFSTKPDNAVGLYFSMRINGFDTLPAGDYSVELLGISFDVKAPPTLVHPTSLIKPQDYLVNESSNGDISTLYVSVPGKDLRTKWSLLNGATYAVMKEEEAQSFTVTLTASSTKYWVGCQVFNYLDISDIPDGSTLSVKFNIDYELADYQPLVGSIRYQVRYFDNAGSLLGNVKFISVADGDFFNETNLDMTLEKPTNAVKMTFILQFMDITIDQTPITFRLNLDSVSFVCDIPTMVRVQQETGRTNQLLNELVNGNHGFDSSGSNFGSDADNLSGAGDQMDSAMGSGMDSLGAMTNSPMFTGTLATLAGAMDAIFVGHEITICGVTANPFTLAATILAIAILLPLALKYVFRKRGSG